MSRFAKRPNEAGIFSSKRWERNKVSISKKQLYCGVDVGASATKLVLLNNDKEITAKVVFPSGVDYKATSRECLARAKTEAGAKGEIVRTVSTGYGRYNVEYANESLTEIHCHGVGCYHYIPHSLTIVDIGGQDNKVIRIDDSGQRLDFKMNRKCAAGTGAFIEEIALRLGIDVGEMDPLARGTTEVVRLSSFCTVFAKTEILAHLRKGVHVAAIVRGAFLSVIQRILEMDPLAGEVALTGGVVAYNPTIAQMLSEKLRHPVEVPPNPQFAGAIGAALVALKKAKSK